MEKASTDDQAVRVREALRDANTPLWFPRLTADLAETAWRKLDCDLCLTRASYGTARMLRQDPGAPRCVATFFDIPSRNGENRYIIPVEILPEDLACRCAGPDVRFFGIEEILGTSVLACVKEALQILDTVPTILPTICSLIRTLHLIDPGDDEVDVSFSDPGLPFSVFVSIPRPNAVAGTLRVAEALLHEAMHLQLTLIEAIVPLVRTTRKAFYSPWRNEYRTAQGVLHALYVFRVVNAFLGAVPFDDLAPVPQQLHARDRQETIARQTQEMHEFRNCEDLTAEGILLVARLLGYGVS